MRAEPGISVDNTTLFRWVQHYAPEMEKRLQWYQGYRSCSWRVDETYVNVKGQWKYYYRAVDKPKILSYPCQALSASIVYYDI
jgi:transposase, IS6 family